MHPRRSIIAILPVLLIAAFIGGETALANDQGLIDLPIQTFRPGELLVLPGYIKPPCDITAQIDRFRSEMALMPLSIGTKSYRYTEKRAGTIKIYNEPETEIALGLLNPDTCERRIVTVVKRGAQLIAPSGYDISVVKRANGIQWNYWNTMYQVNAPSGWFVAANTYPIRENQGGAKKAIVPIFYVLFSEELNKSEFIEMGQDYMLSLARKALDILRERRVNSRAIPGTLLADTVIARPEWLARLGPIEHTDITELALDPDWAIARVYAQIGLNRDDFAAYTCSRAAACGLMQFTDNSAKDENGRVQPGTYTTLRLAYPEARLDPDFTAGARDPLNAMMAAFLHNDDILQKLIASVGPGITSDLAVLEELIDAGYNSGASYIVQAYRAKLDKGIADWTNAVPTCRSYRKVNCLPLETKQYVVAKLRLLLDWHPIGNLTRAF